MIEDTPSRFPAPAGASNPSASPSASEATPATIPFDGSTTSLAPSSLTPELPGYDQLEVLGRGGMAIVYKARQQSLDRLVAVKVILGGAHANPEAVKRFQREAEVLSRLNHPNIVQVYDSGWQGGVPFFCLELCPGGSLADKLRGEPQPAGAASALVEQISRALIQPHAAGIIHRDLKPGNILFAADGTPKVSDFGLARADDSGLTASFALMGTPCYMAPEQAEGESRLAGPVTDVYALGAILYEMLVGRPPFKGASSSETLRLVREAEAVPVRQLQPGLPRDLETICHKCLRKNPSQRYGSVEALAEDLRRFRNGAPIAARPLSWTERAWHWCKRNRLTAAVLAALTVGMLVGTLLSTLLAVRSQAALNQQAEERRQERLVAHRFIYFLRQNPKVLDLKDEREIVELFLKSAPDLTRRDLIEAVRGPGESDVSVLGAPNMVGN